MNFEFKIDKAAANQTASGKKIKSGLTLVKIISATTYNDGSGNPRVNLKIENEEGGKAVIFSHPIAELWTTGSKNSGYRAWNQLLVAASVTDFTANPVKVKVGKKEVDGHELPGLCGGTVLMGLTIEIDVNLSNTKVERYLLRTCYDSLGRTGEQAEKNLPATPAKHFVPEDKITDDYAAAKAAGTLIVEDFGKTSAPAQGTTPAPVATPAQPAAGMFS